MLITLRRGGGVVKRAKKSWKPDKSNIAAEMQKHVNGYLATALHFSSG